MADTIEARRGDPEPKQVDEVLEGAVRSRSGRFVYRFTRHKLGLAGLSINWGFWDEVGMAARSQREMGRGFAPQGMFPFTPPQGLAALRQLLEQEAVQTAVLPTDWPAWWRFHPHAAQSSLFTDLVQLVTGPNPRTTVSEAVPEITRAAVHAAGQSQRLDMLTRFLTDKLSGVLRISADQIDPHEPLNHLGIDSLMAVELRNHVQAKLDVVIPVAELLQNPNLEKISFSTGIPGRIGELRLMIPEGRTKSETFSISVIRCDYDYLQTFGMRLAAGRNFSQEFATDVTKAYIVNATASQKFGWSAEEAIGKELAFAT